jgi:hypothetical protein
LTKILDGMWLSDNRPVRCTHYGSAICVVDLRHRGVRRGMGVAPAGSDRENSGHQHLLVDTELPALSQPIPNVFNHLHFGAVQTERRAHPAAPVRRQGSQSTWSPVVSPRIKVRLVDPSVRKPGRPMPASISLGCRTVRASPAGDDSLRAICVAPAGSDKPNTGHHPRRHQAAAAPPADPERLQPSPLRAEAAVNLPPGRHTLQLLLGDENHVPHNPPVMSRPIRVYVSRRGG